MSALRYGTYVRERDGAGLLYHSAVQWNDPSYALMKHVEREGASGLIEWRRVTGDEAEAVWKKYRLEYGESVFHEDDRYTVIEYTTGYLPDDDDPATFAHLEDARVYASDVLSRLLDFIYDGQSIDDNPPGFTVDGSFQDCLAVVVYDHAKIHDLGRVIEIVELEGE